MQSFQRFSNNFFQPPPVFPQKARRHQKNKRERLPIDSENALQVGQLSPNDAQLALHYAQLAPHYAQLALHYAQLAPHYDQLAPHYA